MDITAIEKLSLKPGDIIVIKLPDESQSNFIFDDSIDNLLTDLAKKINKNNLKNNLIVVLPENIDINKYTKAAALGLLNNQKRDIERIIEELEGKTK